MMEKQNLLGFYCREYGLSCFKSTWYDDEEPFYFIGRILSSIVYIDSISKKKKSRKYE